MPMIGRIESLWRYPVKSMRGEVLEQVFLGFSGVYGDRLYAFQSAKAPKGFPYHTAREQEELLLYTPKFRDGKAASKPANLAEAEDMAPGGQRVKIGDWAELMLLGNGPRCKMITLNPDTAQANPAILRQVTTAHDGTAGLYAAVLVEGIVHPDDPITVVA
jgi:uncharacterized protein YcbX